MDRRNPALEKAIAAAGGTVKVAELLGVKPPAVSNARARGRLSPEHAKTLADTTGVPYIDLVSEDIAAAIRAAR